MYVGIARVEFALHGNDSLKGKRRVANSLKQKMRNRFNVAVAEVEAQDSHTRLVLAAVTVGNDHVHVRRRLDNCISMLEDISPEEMTDSVVEIISGE
ncbi:MAG: DUF503 domain-containing protein [Desulfovibrionaceae bacterium]|jgi:uncharacterized protein YlxP (DUF503 family)|nr:DUF503 domain-containing protein [Desulfovibrionaceae bacterium]